MEFPEEILLLILDFSILVEKSRAKHTLFVEYSNRTCPRFRKTMA
jgi:hypothetical protein